jgi:antitoxin VapB
MPERAKIFQNGGSQAVRLPKSCRFDGQTELVVRRVGRKVILEPADDWSPEFLACLGAWQDEIPRPEAQSIAARKNPLERR